LSGRRRRARLHARAECAVGRERGVALGASGARRGAQATNGRRAVEHERSTLLGRGHKRGTCEWGVLLFVTALRRRGRGRADLIKCLLARHTTCCVGAGRRRSPVGAKASPGSWSRRAMESKRRAARHRSSDFEKKYSFVARCLSSGDPDGAELEPASGQHPWMSGLSSIWHLQPEPCSTSDQNGGVPTEQRRSRRGPVTFERTEGSDRGSCAHRVGVDGLRTTSGAGVGLLYPEYWRVSTVAVCLPV
jgi:hypothetical protein